MPNSDRQRTPIVLPSQTWVSQWYLRRAIAEAFFPDHRKSAGVDLLTNKTLRSGPGAGLPYELSGDDRSLLSSLAC